MGLRVLSPCVHLTYVRGAPMCVLTGVCVFICVLAHMAQTFSVAHACAGDTQPDTRVDSRLLPLPH